MSSVELNQTLSLINQCILENVIKGGNNVIYYWPDYWSTGLLKTNENCFIDYFT